MTLLRPTLTLLWLLLVQQVAAYWILDHSPLVRTRIDPIVNPGEISSHVHNVLGGSRFSPTYDYDDLRASTCTTAAVTIDKSYWAPQLYYYDPVNKTYSAIASYSKTYYLQRPGSKNEKIHQFPAGLKMLAGNPFRRTYNGSNFAEQAISFVCLDYYHSHTGDAAWDQRSDGWFSHNCPDGMRTQIFFPQCWNGKDLYKSDQSHMAYPVDSYQGGNCPSTHPIHLIGLFYEFVYSVGDWPFNAAGTPTWVFANGDTTGLGMHADFTNGWPNETNSVFQQAIDTCGLETGGDIDACAVFAPYIDYDQASACQIEGDIVNESVGWKDPLKKLPGNNPMWTGSSTTKPSIAGYVEGATYTSASSVVLPDWSLLGCIIEPSDGRALSAASFTSSSMTIAKCVAYCAKLGLPLAGAEYGSECYCDSVFRNEASNTTVPLEQCSMTCAGLATENCGGSSRLTVWQNPSLASKVTLPTGWATFRGGCMTDDSNTRALSGATMSSKNMTVSLCVEYCHQKGFIYAGLEYGQECYCNNSWASSATPDTEGGCNMACVGKLSQTCGGASRLSSYYNSKKATGSSSSSASSTSSTAASSSTRCLSPAQSSARSVASAKQTASKASSVRLSATSKARRRMSFLL